MTLDVDAFLDEYTPPSEQVPICSKAGLLAEHAALDAEVLQHRMGEGLGGPPAEMLERLSQLEADIEASVVLFTVGAVSAKEWSDLVAAHPPTKPQRDTGNVANPDTFDPEIVAASSVDPVLTVDQAERLRATLPSSEWDALCAAVWRVNQKQTSAPKSLALSVTRLTSELLSDTPPDTGSLAEPSSVSAAAP